MQVLNKYPWVHTGLNKRLNKKQIDIRLISHAEENKEFMQIFHPQKGQIYLHNAYVWSAITSSPTVQSETGKHITLQHWFWLINTDVLIGKTKDKVHALYDLHLS